MGQTLNDTGWRGSQEGEQKRFFSQQDYQLE